MSSVTIDHVDNVAIDSTLCMNELGTLRTLTAGLTRLVGFPKSREMQWMEQTKAEK